MYRFPRDFDFGIASSAYQMEGGYNEDGKGPSIWDVFVEKPGAIAGGGTGKTGCDHYHHWREDVGLLRELGVRTYRLSVAWSRVFPQGDGPLNQKGLDFYRRLTDALLENGISPMVNLHHYDLPQSLYERGGWMNRDTIDAYVRYAETVFDALSPQVSRYLVFNDVRGTLLGGYVSGERAPGRRGELRQAIEGWHSMHVAGARAVEAFRSRGVPGGEIGCVMGLIPVRAADDTPECRALADAVGYFYNDAFLAPLIQGVYPERTLDALESMRMMPSILTGDLETIAAGTVDMMGVSYYTPMTVRVNPQGDPSNPMSLFTRCAEGEKTDMGWVIDPTGMYDVLTHIRDTYGNPRVFVGETGAAFADTRRVRDVVMDDDRIAYLKAHIDQVARAIDDGCNVDAVHLWTFLDNFEWQYGFTKQFGLVAVDHATGQRMPKKSYAWYQAFLRDIRS
ncbi:family 1 glycosylhydrolase [Eubacteriales bacterium OttesenSCG-928-A19]|nr:family 1 glycosylhydrolase [Eubacteriales bacterium OttesenSCG-928-A19]